MSVNIEKVTARHLDQVVPLIGEYQRFYRVTPDTARNRAFFGQLTGENPLGTLFIATGDNGEALGFATLYFLPSSLSARTMCVLNDLYTVPETRGRGVARALIRHCRAHAEARGFSSLEWQTEVSNEKAQRLYDRLPAQRTSWYTYSLPTRESHG